MFACTTQRLGLNRQNAKAQTPLIPHQVVPLWKVRKEKRLSQPRLDRRKRGRRMQCIIVDYCDMILKIKVCTANHFSSLIDR